IGAVSPSSAMRARQAAQIGWYRWSFTSHPAIAGVCSSRRAKIWRIKPCLVFDDEGTAGGTDRVVRVVVHLAPRDRRRLLVQEVHDLADQAGLGLPPPAQAAEGVAS